MAESRTTELRIDATQGAQALAQVERAAEGAAEAMGALAGEIEQAESATRRAASAAHDHAAEVEKTETTTRRLTTSSRDYQAAARSVGDSVQAITRFEQAYRASLADTANDADTRARILAAAFARTVGGAADETRATALLAAGHRDAAEAVRVIIEHQARLAQAIREVAGYDTAAAAAARSNAAIRSEAIRAEAEVRRQEVRSANQAYLSGTLPSGGKSAGESAGVFAQAFREETQAAEAATAALIRRQRAEREDQEIAAQWQAMLAEEASAKQAVVDGTLEMGDAAVHVSGQMAQARQIIQANLINIANVGLASGWDPALMLSPLPDVIYGLKEYYEGSQKAAEAARETGEAASVSAEDIAATGEVADQAGTRLRALAAAGAGTGGGLIAAAVAASAVAAAFAASVVAAVQYRDALEDVDKALKLTGQISGQTASGLEAMAHTMAASGRISVSEAREIEQAMLAAGTVSSEAFKTAAGVVGDWASLTGAKAVEAAKDIATSLGEPAKAAELLARQYGALTAEQVRAIEKMARLGDEAGAQKAVLEGYQTVIRRAAEETSLWTRAVNTLSDAWKQFGGVTSGPVTTIDKLAAARERLAQLEKGGGSGGWMFGREGMVAAERQRVAELERQLAEEQERARKAEQDTKATRDILDADKVARSALPATVAREDLAAQGATLKTGLDAAKAAGDAKEADRLAKALEAVAWAEKTYVTEGERARLLAEAQAKAMTMGEVAGQKYLALRQAEIGVMGKVLDQGEREQVLAATRTTANATAAKAYGDQQKQIAAAAIDAQRDLALSGLDIERQALAQRRALLEISGAEEEAQARQIEERQRGIEMDAAQAKLTLLRKDHADQITEIAAAEAEITALRARHTLERQQQAVAEATARRQAARDLAPIKAEGLASQANHDVSVAEENLSFGKSMGTIDGGQEIAELRRISEQKFQIEQDDLNRKLSLAQEDEAAQERINNQIADSRQRASLRMLQIDHQEALGRRETMRSMVAPFTGAIQSMTAGYIQGTLTWDKLTKQAAQSIVLSYANMGMKVATDQLEKHVLMAAWDKLFGAETVATTTATEAGKTSASTVGAGTRAAVGVSENVSFFGRIATQIGEWLGFETAKTGATAGQAATRATIDTTASIAAIAAAKAEAAGEIPAYAGIGAAAAMASVAAIPFVGWAMAPGVGAEHAALAMSFLGLAVAEKGWGEVPADDMPALLHKKEMVLPASLAVPLRALLTGSAAITASDAGPVASAAGPLRAASSVAAATLTAGGIEAAAVQAAASQTEANSAIIAAAIDQQKLLKASEDAAKTAAEENNRLTEANSAALNDNTAAVNGGSSSDGSRSMVETLLDPLGLASFDVGAWNLPSDMIAQVHQGEMIIPPDQAEMIRRSAGLAPMRPMPRLGLPDFVRQSPAAGWAANKSVTNSRSEVKHTVNVGPITVNGPVRKQDIMNMKAEISEAVFKAQRDGNAFALALSRGKK